MKSLVSPDLLGFRTTHPMEALMGPLPQEYRQWVGAFLVPYRNGMSRKLKVIASKGGGPEELYGPGGNWDHVSISVNGSLQPPSWDQMCFIKDLFFEPDEVAMQLHPVSEYINNHPGCLHLWRPLDVPIPLPPSVLVGLPELNPA